MNRSQLLPLYFTTAQLNPRLSGRHFIIFVALLSLYRWLLLYTGELNIHFDEAQYWLWAQKPAWGYFSKPPMIAWMIAVYQPLFGDSVVALKSLSLVTYLFTAGVVYALAHRVHNHQVARYSVLLFLTMPAVSISAMAITTDVFLIFFWSLALWLVVLSDDIRGIPRYVNLFLLGVTIGLGLLTKYTMVLFLLSMVLWYQRWPISEWSRLVFDGILVTVIALVTVSPNLWWNATHQMASFKHLHEISQVSTSRFHVAELLNFWGAQIGMMGLLSTLLFVWFGLFALSKDVYDRSIFRWFCFFIVFFTVISIQALISRAFANWAAPCFVSAIIWLSYSLHRQGRVNLLVLAILVNMMTMIGIYHFEALYRVVGIPLTENSDIKRQLRGWDVLAGYVSPVLQEFEDCTLLADNRKVLTELIYYVEPHPYGAQLFNPGQRLQNMFHLTQNLDQQIGHNFIWVTRGGSLSSMRQYFRYIRFITEVTVPVSGAIHYYQIYYLGHFNGYNHAS